MEKLQQAIAQARKDRVSQGQSRRRSGATQTNAADIWSTIQPLAPDLKHLTRKRVMSHESTSASVPFDVLRTKIQQLMRQNEWKRLMITSPSPHCGKTTIAANLAFGLARQGEDSAILIELDLRRPGLSGVLGKKPSKDVRDVLSGKLSFGEQAFRIGTKVAISMALNKSSDPTQILSSAATLETLTQIEADYAPDLLIFDTPPMLVNDDTRSLLPHVDCVLLVAQAEATTSQQIDICEREIAENTNLLGVVLNQCKYPDETQGYGYEYY